eukprot:TRINITY_DN8104_c0_g1_i1.p1 TRINITY_DN8104_c0_g1~~TRINITY_DN8104_c0_g1_i1.p1  ORF type:complete len:594 (-),score=136.15 TRINITY_DN8104_c0_g1_i1:10-1791(-)
MDVSDLSVNLSHTDLGSDSEESDAELEDLASLQHHVELSLAKAATGQAEYLEMCHELRLIPATVVVNGLESAELNLSHHGLRTKGGTAFAACLRVNEYIKKLYLGDNWLEAKGGIAILEALLDNTAITTVDLSDNRIGILGSEALARLVKLNKTITSLNLRGNNLTDAAAEIICEALKDNSTMTALDLSHNEFGPRGATALASMVLVNSRLRTLDLSWNKIRGDGAKALGPGLKDNNGLQSLNLAWNALDEQIGKSIGEGLELNTTLTHLDLSHNRIIGQGALALAKALTINTTLESISITDNPINRADATALVQAICNNVNITNAGLDKLDVNWPAIQGVPSWYDASNPIGHYELVLSRPADRIVAQQLLQRSLKTGNERWTNVTLDTKPMALPAFLERWRLPVTGKLCLDYINITHPRAVPEPMRADKFEKLLSLMTDDEPQMEMPSPAAPAPVVPSSAGKKGKKGKKGAAEAKPAKAAAGKAPAKKGGKAVAEDLPPPPAVPLTLIQRLARFVSHSHISSAQVATLLRALPEPSSADVIELITSIYPFVTDKGYFTAVLLTLQRDEQTVLCERLQLPLPPVAQPDDEQPN